MPRPRPPEFRQRAVELARLKEKPMAQIAEDLGISDSCLRGWMKQADLDGLCCVVRSWGALTIGIDRSSGQIVSMSSSNAATIRRCWWLSVPSS